jgi:glycosyltransferase involved in cell wall biosynthesis
MNNPEVDIIVPVWNKPVETRDCLVHLMEYSPDARLILVDNGSDRDTERLLQEFAEILDYRALLLRNEINRGEVRAVNRGMVRAEAPYVAIVRNTSIVTAGWLEPLLDLAREKTEAGLVVPRLIPAAERKGKGQPAPPLTRREEEHGSLAAMLVTKRLYDSIGGLDEEMDGGVWCLRDYSRQAYRNGYLTFGVAGGAVYFTEEQPLGSVARREETVRRSSARYRERWGEAGAFCVYLPRDADGNILRQRLDIIVEGARQGHSITILVHPQLYKAAVQAGYHSLHGNIRFEPLPALFASSAISKHFARLRQAMPDLRAVTGIDGVPFPGVAEGMPFARLAEAIAETRTKRYGG